MNKLFKHIFLFILFPLWGLGGYAQQYPVRLIPVVIPPYSLKLGDYATSTDNKLQLQVLMTDLMEPQHKIGIRFSLQAGLNAVPFAQSNDFVVGMQPFMLYPGSNVTLTNIDLRALFELQNLNGINASQYAQPLADGVYQFCFQAYDFYTKRNLSQKTCATVFLVQYDPPMLNLPQNAEKIQAVSPYAGGSGIVFQWMPRQIAPNTKYIFTLKELWDMGQSPISGFLSSPPLWREETYSPNLYYGLDKTQLIPGKRYAWQIQAKSGNPVPGANPTQDNGVYKNNGLSEIFYFDYVENCALPTLLMAKNAGRGRVELSWNLAGQPSGLYSLQYRKRGSTSQWQTAQSYQPRYTVTDLEDQTEYEYRIGSVCGNLQTFNNTNPITDGNAAGNAYAFSGTQYFTTDNKDKTNQNYQCGVMPAVDIANKNPLQSLLGANEVFTAGDFPVTVIAAQGSNGIYSGTGYIVVPYLADTKVKVSFNNIKLNTDKKLIEGVIETTYDPTEKNVVDVKEIVDDIKDVYKSIEFLINDIKERLQEQTQNGTITPEKADEIIKEITKQEEIAQKSNEEVKQTQEQIAKEKEENKEQEPTQEQKNKIETAKESIKGAHNKLEEIANKLGVNAGKGNRESDSYFQGLLPLAVNNGTVQIKTIIEGKPNFTIKTIDTNFLESYSTTISGKKYTFVITTSNSTKEELEKAKNMVDHPTDGIVIYNYYDLKKNKLGYKVNFANNFFNGIKQQDIEEIRDLYTEALNNKLEEAQNVIDWGSEIFKATTEINTVFQDLMNKIVLPESIWNPANKEYASGKHKIQALDAGLIDGALEQIKSIPLLISLMVDYTTSSKTREKINQAFSDFSFKEAMKKWYEERKELYKNQSKSKIEHQTGKDVVEIGTLIGTGGLAGITNVKKGLNFVEDLVDIVKTKGVKESIELVGKYNWALMRKYFNHIQEMTGRAILQKQIDKLKEALRLKEYKKLAPDEYKLHQKEYTSLRREKMIKEWEKNTGQTWPVDENGRRYQLHHIIEQQYGGPNEWWNSHPAKFPDEHQGGIHAAGSPSRELFK